MDRNSLLAQAHSILQKNNYTKEDSAKVESLLALADACTDKEPLRRAVMAQRDVELGRQPSLPIMRTLDAKFQAYMRGGRGALDSADQAKILPENILPNITNAMAVGTGSSGGYLTPQQFSDRVAVVMQQYDEIFELAQLFETSNGAVAPYPLVDDFQNGAPVPATIVSENAPSSEQDLAFATLTFPDAQHSAPLLLGVG